MRDGQGADAPAGQDARQVFVEAECAAFDAALADFSSVMRARFREKALQGESGWDRPENCHGFWLQAMALMAAHPQASNHEADAANYLAFLWACRTRSQRRETATGGRG